jgi:two-component system phosphate regulon response regulator PhoB
LIVEDDSRVAGVIQMSLELEGEPSWAVQKACGGKHALELAGATSPDLVLLDVWLPDLDGAEVYHQLRSNPHTRDARVLFLSAGTSLDLFQHGIEDGVLLRKPFNMTELVSLVRALLDE